MNSGFSVLPRCYTCCKEIFAEAAARVLQVGTMLYVFGGVVIKDASCSNELLWMSTDRMEWHNQPCKGDKPCPRHHHTAVYDEEGNQLVIFGGRCAAFAA
jgi:hypothetical protein